jgi:transposase
MVKCSRNQVARLKKVLQREKDLVVRQRIQMILLREDGKTQPEIAELTGVSLSTVNRAHMAYDDGGVNALRPKPKGGRRNENMTLEEEKRFLARFTKTAGAGELLNIGALKMAYEEEIGHPTSDSTIYNLLARHQWRKLMPRPFHPERDEEAQEAYKKKVPPSREEGSAHRRGQRPALASHVRR